jgi:CheY-like chemotaxis protein
VGLDREYTRTHPETEPGEYVMLAVSDTGAGMDKAVLDHLFEPFFTTKPRGRGTGLGLSTCYGIVKQNRGSISVYSEPGHGTTFKVCLPAVPEAKPDQPEAEQAYDQYNGVETILAVEDDGTVRNIIVRILEDRGYTVLAAANGREAIKVANGYSGTIHLLLSDVIMPLMGGKELSQRISELRPGIRTVFMSGYTDNSIVHHGVLDPGVEFIQKPFSPLTLEKNVREVLDK